MAEVILSYANFSLPAVPAILTSAEASEPTFSDQADGSGILLPASDDGSGIARHEATDEQIAQARAIFASGGSVGEAARASGMAWSTARLHLDNEIADSGRQLVTWHEMTVEEVTEAAQLHAEGWTYVALGKKYGVSHQAVSRRLKAYNSAR